MIKLICENVNLLILLIPIIIPRSHSMRGLDKQPSQQYDRERINKLFFQVKASLQQLNSYSDRNKQKQGNKLLYSYLNILENTALELQRARAKYESINKEQLIDQKMQDLALNLKSSKSQAIIMNDMVGKINKQIKQVKERNDLLEWNIEILKKQLSEKQADRKLAKDNYRSNYKLIMLTSIPLVQNVESFKGNNNSQKQFQQIKQIKTGRFSARTKATKPKERGQSFSQVFGFK